MNSSKKTVGRCCVAAVILLCACCASTKPNVNLTITDGKSVKHITGRIPEPSNPFSLVLGIGTDALKYIFPAL